MLIDSGNGGAGAVRDAERILVGGQGRRSHADRPPHHDSLPRRSYRGPGGARGPHSYQGVHRPRTEYSAQPGYRSRFSRADTGSCYSKTKHTVAKPGDKIPVAGVDWRVVTSATEVIKTPLQGKASPNPYCAGFTPQTGVNLTEDDQSVGSFITFGKFRTIHLGDLTLNRQFDLMCPNNRLGTVDLLIAARVTATSMQKFSSHARRPRVIVTNNGTRKGAQPEAMKIFFASPNLEDVWQIHFSQLGGQEYTVPGMFIANLFDEQQEAMPVAPFTPPPQGQQAPPAPRAQREGVLHQDLGAAGRHLHGDQHPQRLQQNAWAARDRQLRTT